MDSEDINRLVQKGIEAGKLRNYSLAVSIFTHLLEEGWPDALLLLGRAYHGLGEYSLGAQLLKNYLNLYPNSGPGWFFLGRSFLNLQLYSKSIGAFLKAIKLGSNDSQLWGLLGTAYMKNRQPDLSVSAFQKAVESNPTHRGIYMGYLNALLVQAIQKFHQNNFPLSRQILEFLKNQGVQSSTIHVYLANINSIMGDFSSALREYSQASVYQPEDQSLLLHQAECLISLGKITDAQALLDKIPQLTHLLDQEVAPGDMEMRLAVQLMNQKKYRQAIFQSLKSIKKPHPEAGFFYTITANAYYALGDATKALAHFRQARKRLPHQVELLYKILSLLWEMENYKEIREEIKNYPLHKEDETCKYYDLLAFCKLNSNPVQTIPDLEDFAHRIGPDAFLFEALGKEYLQKKDKKSSYTWNIKALKLHPALKPALLNLLECGEVKQKSLGKYLKKYLEYRCDDLQITKIYTRLLFTESRYPEAIRYIQKQMERYGMNPGLNRSLAYCYRQDHQYEKALALYQTLLKQEEKNPIYITNVVYCLEKTGQGILAERFATKALEMNHNNLELIFYLGIHHKNLGNRSKASQYFRKALEINPQLSVPWNHLADLALMDGDIPKSERYRKQAEKLKV